MAQHQHLQPASARRPGRGRTPRVVAALALAGVAIAFALLNTSRVKVHYIVATGHPQLIFVIVGCLLIGGLVGLLAGRRPRGRR